MSTPVGKISKPEAEAYRKGRKLYLVPLFLVSPEPPDDLREKLEQYWNGAEEHIARLEAALGPVNRIYHETVYLPGEEGAKLIEGLNPGGYRLISRRCQGGAILEPTEDWALLEESSDWQGCLSLGLVSQKASSTVFQAYLEVTSKRYEHIASRIDETLGQEESAILMVGDNHRVQFPSDIQVFYVAPPVLNDLRRWVEDRLRQGVGREEEQARDEGVPEGHPGREERPGE